MVHDFRTTVGKSSQSRKLVAVFTACMLMMGLAAEPLVGQTRAKLDPEKVRAEIEKTRREMEQRRRSTNSGLGTTSYQARKTSESRVSSTKSTSAESTKSLAYQFSPGKQFAYLVLMEWRSGESSHRIMGTPFYQVRYQCGSKSTAMVIGRFRHYIKSASDDDYRPLPSKDYWTQSIQILGQRAIEGYGRDAKGTLDVPFLMTEFVEIPTLIVPGLPVVMDRKLGKSESAVVSRTANGATLWEGFSSNGGSGRVSRYIEAKAIGATSVKLDVERSFVQKDLSAVYTSQAVFSLTDGLLNQSQGTYDLNQNGQSTRVNVIVRRLSGTDLDVAKSAAIADLAKLPKDVFPTQLARKPVELTLPASYSRENPPAVNESVAYYDRDMSQYYLVTTVKQLARDSYRVRFEGSGEILEVNPGSLKKIGRAS